MQKLGNNLKENSNNTGADGNVPENVEYNFDENNPIPSVSPMQGKRQLGAKAEDPTEKKAPNDTPFLTHYKKPMNKRKTLEEAMEQPDSQENNALLKF